MKTSKDLYKLDPYETELEASLKTGKNILNLDVKKKAQIEKAAREYLLLSGTKRINIRVSREDLIKVRSKAKTSNVPYQTLLGSLIRKFANGELTISI